MKYAEDRQWSDRFIPEIKRIVGPYLLTTTPDEIDCSQAADLMVFTARDMRLAALPAFRAALVRQGMNGRKIICGDMANGDGTFFKWFDIRSFPPEPPLIVASSATIDAPQAALDLGPMPAARRPAWGSRPASKPNQKGHNP
jgi:hypothetical protein